MKFAMVSKMVVAFAMASGMVAAPPLLAAKKEKEQKAPAMKFSKPIQAILSAAQKLQQGGDDAAALAKLAEAQSIPDQTVDDVYMVNALTLNSGITTNNNDIIANRSKRC